MLHTTTILAIDGAGRQTQEYCDLLRGTLRVFSADRAVLLTSDASARDPDVVCTQIPKLGYLEYSRFCVETVTRYVDTEFALFVQLDGFIVNPERWDDGFFAYDYVGPPWRSTRKRPLAGGYTVGNGGFSLRSKRFLDASSRLDWHADWAHVKVPKKYWGNEDYFLCVLERQKLEAAGIHFAPLEVAKAFGVQKGDRFDAEHKLATVFGFHGKKLVRRAKRYVERRQLHYPHLAHVTPSILPFGY